MFLTNVKKSGYSELDISHIIKKIEQKSSTTAPKPSYLAKSKVTIKVPYSHHLIAKEILNVKKVIGFLIGKNINIS